MRKISTSLLSLAVAAACLQLAQSAHAEQQAAGAATAAMATAAATPSAAPAGAAAPVAVPVPVTAPTPAPAAADKSAKSKWLWPLESAKARVSSFFGALRGRRAHGGVDISTPVGTPVKATDSGVVVASTNRYEGDKKYGEVVVIEHLNGFKSLYAHLNTRDVKVGDEVVAGQSIGQSGKTGHSTGPHLHLEAFYNGARTDPKNLLAGLEESALPSALSAKQYTSTDGSFVTKAPYVAPAKAGKAGKAGKAVKSGKAKSSKVSTQKHITNRAPKSSKKSGRK
jgi:murein DD-endopeptidase MepM/ murein hydrolase activator NlpD